MYTHICIYEYVCVFVFYGFYTYTYDDFREYILNYLFIQLISQLLNYIHIYTHPYIYIYICEYFDPWRRPEWRHGTWAADLVDCSSAGTFTDPN